MSNSTLNIEVILCYSTAPATSYRLVYGRACFDTIQPCGDTHVLSKIQKKYITQDVCNQFNAKCPCDPLCSTIPTAPHSPGMDVPALRATNPTRRHIFIAQCKKLSITQDMGKKFNAEYPGDTLLFHTSNDIIPTWE